MIALQDLTANERHASAEWIRYMDVMDKEFSLLRDFIFVIYYNIIPFFSSTPGAAQSGLEKPEVFVLLVYACGLVRCAILPHDF